MNFSNLPHIDAKNLIDLSLLMYKYKDFVIKRYKTRRDTIWQSVRNSQCPQTKWHPLYDIKNIPVHYVGDDKIAKLSHSEHNISLGVDWDVTEKMEVCVFHSGDVAYIVNDIPIYETDGAYACDWKFVPGLLKKYSKIIRELCFPPEHRIKSDLFSEFLTTIQNGIDCKCYKSKYYDGDDKYGVFSWAAVYRYVEWDFEMVEKYKDQIDWVTFLKNNTNLTWNEQHYERFHRYLLKYITWDYVCPPEKFVSIIPFSFLWKYKEQINFEKVLGNSNLSLSISEMQLLFDYLKNRELPVEPHRDKINRGTYKTKFYSLVLNNSNYIWTEDQLRFCSRQDYDNSRWPAAQKYTTAYNTKQIIDNLLNTKNNFATIQQRNIAYDFYEQYSESQLPILTPEMILTHCNEWNKQVKLQFTGYSYHSDGQEENYHEVTGWELLYKSYVLTYETCKTLKDLTMRVGSSYFDDTYYNDDYFVNALLYCSQNEIKNQDELTKIISDSEVLEYFFVTQNWLVVDYAIEIFFTHYSYEDFKKSNINIVNNKFKDIDLYNLYKHVKY